MGTANEVGGYRREYNFFDLRCSVCEKYLSVPPIRSTANGDINICGRCEDPKVENKKKLFRNVLFESVAEFITFPSSSNCGCPKQWNVVTLHDEDCPRRRLDCFHPGCKGFVRFCDLVSHFRQSHHVCTGYGTTLLLGIHNRGVTLLEIESYAFAFVYCIGAGTVWYNVFNLNYENRIKIFFKFMVTDPETNISMRASQTLMRWDQHRNIFDLHRMYALSIPHQMYFKSSPICYTVHVTIGPIGIEDAPTCRQCQRSMCENNCHLCPNGHALCHHCNELCVECEYS